MQQYYCSINSLANDLEESLINGFGCADIAA